MRRRSGTGLAGNTLILTAGTLVQTVVALVTVPLYLSELGEARFGAFVIVGVIVGYFGLLDRALNAGVQNEVARLGEDPETRSRIIWTGAIFNAGVGIVSGLAVFVTGAIVFSRLIELPAELHTESIEALDEIAASVPFVTVSAVFQGALMANNRIATVSALETFRILALQLLPLGFVYWQGPDLRWLAIGFLLALALSSVGYFAACLALVLRPHTWVRPTREIAVRLFHYGKWITATSVLTPLLDFSDRVVIGAVRGASAVTTYAIPYNLTSRLTIIPFNVVRVMFPRFSAVSADDSRALGVTALAAVAAVTAPAAVLGSILSGPFFDWWLGGDVAKEAAPIAAVLFAGFWINGLGYVPSTLLQAQGRPDRPARFHALELVPFLLVLALGVHLAGPMGGAVAWSCRALADALLLLTAASLGWWSNRLLLATSALVAIAAVCGALLAFAPAAVLAPVGAVLFSLSVVFAWFLIPEDYQAKIREMARRARRSGGPGLRSSEPDER
jgi:O-antigen/teichoic acid export membrane protein